ncbi:MAG: AAA family ATPase [Dehalococcoidia bacterium]|nr:AAA family ATPase [Dehalococcoidia bacterium]
MTFSIAIAGKGGSGKTTTCALILRELIQRRMTPILAVDADGNANLHESMGLRPHETIGSVIDKFNGDKINLPQGMNKGSYLRLRLSKAIAESHGVDLISMGHGAGSGCYCYPNSILKEFIDALRPNYKFIVMDNEAGMEHLSRGTTDGIDMLLIASDYSVKGIRTAARIRQMVDELKLDVKESSFILTRVPDALDGRVVEELDTLGINPAAFIPRCAEIERFDLEQQSLLDLPDTSPAAVVIAQLLKNILERTGRAA